MEIDVKLINIYSINNICRLCLNVLVKDNYHELFIKNNIQCDSFKSRLEECLSLKIVDEENLPPYICYVCVEKVNAWYDFKQTARRSYLQLQQINSTPTPVNEVDNACKVIERPDSSEWESRCFEDSTTSEPQKVEEVDDAADSQDSEENLFIKAETCNISENGDDNDDDEEEDDDDDRPLIEILKKDDAERSKNMHNKNSRGRAPNKVKPFCTECNMKFSRFPEFFAHRQDVHGETTAQEDLKGVDSEAFAIYRCHKCKEEYSCRETLRAHCRNVHKIKVIQPYICSHCERQFPSWCLLVVHERQHTGEKPYSCDVCGKENFISLASLRRHKLMHLKVYHCTECGRDFNCDSALKAHIRCKHTNEKPYLCNICGRSFSLATILNAHMTSHSSERKYKCEICGFASKTSGNHHRHKARHQQGGEKTFHCETCGKAFETKIKLSSHQIIHRPVRPHVCKLCGKGFLYNNKLERHILLVHARERPYPCHLCGRKLASNFGLRIHLKTHTKTEPQEQLPTDSVQEVHLILQ